MFLLFRSHFELFHTFYRLIQRKENSNITHKMVPETSDWKQLIATLNLSPSSTLRLAYIDNPPTSSYKGVILLLHGFPQTSYQFRHVINPLSDAGYRIIAPDYRGAGKSSKPSSDFTKSTMASDMIKLLDYLKIKEPSHVVGHDIGGMIAYALASRYLDRVASVTWGECPLPETSVYEADRTTHAVQQFHFIFHSVLDLPEALVAGRERIYINHFFSKIAYNTAAISELDLDYYASTYEQPGAMRCAFEIYRAFEVDKEENRKWMEEKGKCTVPAMAFSGEMSRHKDEAEEMFGEVHEKQRLEVAIVENAGHYLAEENPDGFVRELLRFIEKQSK